MIKIRKAKVVDFPAVLNLIKHLAKYENAEHAVVNTVEKMTAEQDCFYCLVAETAEKEIVGMALYYHVYYTWVGKSMYLDDLVVLESHRGNKIGSRLLEKVYAHAVDSGCNRLRWQVLDWNEPAIGFYKKLGVKLDEEWINCDVVFEEKL